MKLCIYIALILTLCAVLVLSCSSDPCSKCHCKCGDACICDACDHTACPKHCTPGCKCKGDKP